MQQNTVMIPLRQLRVFRGHPYRVRHGAEMEELIESIRANGILTPLIVRPVDGSTTDYEIVSGHRRFFAAREAGLKEVPAFVYAISRTEASILLVDSNLHREHVLPSEKAFAYKMKMDALKQQGHRSDLTSDQVGPRLTAAEISDTESASQVKRFIRLTHLHPELLEMVDNGRIALSVGVELSYLTEMEQESLLNSINENICTPSYAQAVRLHKAAVNDTLTEEMIEAMLSEPKPNQQEHIRLKRDDYAKFFPRSYTPAQIERDILKGLELLKRQRERHRDAR